MGKRLLTISVGGFMFCTLMMVQAVTSQSIDDLFTPLWFRDDDATDHALNTVNKITTEFVDEIAQPAETIIGKLQATGVETRASYVIVEKGDGNGNGRTSAERSHEQVTEKSTVVSAEPSEGTAVVVTADHPTPTEVETGHRDHAIPTAVKTSKELEITKALNSRVYSSEKKVTRNLAEEPARIGVYSFMLFKPRVPGIYVKYPKEEEATVKDYNTTVAEVIGAPKIEHLYRTPIIDKSTSLKVPDTNRNKHIRTDTNTKQDISTRNNNYDLLRRGGRRKHSILNILINPKPKFTEEPYMFNTLTTPTSEF